MSIEGLPDIRADFRAGQVCATVANVHRREDQDAYQAHDFMPVLREAMPDAKVGATTDATPDAQAAFATAIDTCRSNRRSNGLGMM